MNTLRIEYYLFHLLALAEHLLSNRFVRYALYLVGFALMGLGVVEMSR